MTSVVRPFGIYVHIGNSLQSLAESVSTVINLSKATRLNDVIFLVKSVNVEWITAALQTITPENQDLQRIVMYAPYYSAIFGLGRDVRETIGELAYGRWLDLDHLLVHFWESRSIRPTVMAASHGMRSLSDLVGGLLPEITGRGIMDLVEQS